MQFLLDTTSTLNSLSVDIFNKFEEELNGEFFRLYFFENDATDI
jgi:hypothetical protein